MRYKGNEYNLREYFDVVMKEDGFVDETVEKVKGYYRSEAEYNIIADYIGSCGLEKEEDIAFVKEMGFTLEDFED